MQVIRAEEMGMCFGVRDALAVARSITDPSDVTIHGELVHNEEVSSELANRGFNSSSEAERGTGPSETSRVLITAHGVSNSERRQLEAAGNGIIDTTCPLVRHVHTTALDLDRSGYFVIIIGKRDHVETIGLTGDLSRHVVVETADDVVTWPERRLGIVCQTTTAPAHASEVLASIRAHNPDAEIREVDTICGPTRNRQESLLSLFKRIEALVVVGGRGSNNTRALVRLAEENVIPVAHVQTAVDLDAEWLARFETVGLTAGTSTLDQTIDEVHRALLDIPGHDEQRRAG